MLTDVRPAFGRARCKVAQKEDDRSADGRPLISESKFNKIFNAIITHTKKEGKALNPPKALYADINHQDNNGKTPLYMAIEHSHVRAHRTPHAAAAPHDAAARPVCPRGMPLTRMRIAVVRSI